MSYIRLKSIKPFDRSNVRKQQGSREEIKIVSSCCLRKYISLANCRCILHVKGGFSPLPLFICLYSTSGFAYQIELEIMLSNHRSMRFKFEVIKMHFLGILVDFMIAI